MKLSVFGASGGIGTALVRQGLDAGGAMSVAASRLPARTWLTTCSVPSGQTNL